MLLKTFYNLMKLIFDDLHLKATTMLEVSFKPIITRFSSKGWGLFYRHGLIAE